MSNLNSDTLFNGASLTFQSTHIYNGTVLRIMEHPLPSNLPTFIMELSQNNGASLAFQSTHIYSGTVPE